MDDRLCRKLTYATARQKRKLVELVTKHPQLITGKVTKDFNHIDSQKQWQSIANECNSIPGARKSWRQWKKTWQDLKSYTKKRQRKKNDMPLSVITLTAAEQEALGIKNVSSTTSYQEATEFVPLDQDTQEEYNNEAESALAYSEPESPPEIKHLTCSETKEHKAGSSIRGENHSRVEFTIGQEVTDNCSFNCNLLASVERRKMQLKEDFMNYRKGYLRQKLKLIEEQTEALKTIAKELAK